MSLETVARCSQCRRTAGWGTDHPGTGNCRDHDTRHVPTIEVRRSGSYSSIIKDERLNTLVQQYEDEPNPDDLDNQIILLKALTARLAEELGTTVTFNTDGELENQQVFDFDTLSGQAKDLARIVRTLAGVVRTKHSILLLTREAIPRSDVRQYINNVITILQKYLRDSCPSCDHRLDILSKVMEEFKLLPEL